MIYGQCHIDGHQFQIEVVSKWMVLHNSMLIHWTPSGHTIIRWITPPNTMKENNRNIYTPCTIWDSEALLETPKNENCSDYWLWAVNPLWVQSDKVGQGLNWLMTIEPLSYGRPWKWLPLWKRLSHWTSLTRES